MAGHSQFKNIMHRKGAQDAKRAKLFTRLQHEIFVAAQQGGPDPDTNPRLRTALYNARQANLPKDNVERTLRKLTEEGSRDMYESLRYEGFGPHNVAVLVEVLTDNRNRSASEIRTIFSKQGGKMGEGNSVSFMFLHQGSLSYSCSPQKTEALLMDALEAGAVEVSAEGEHCVIVCPKEQLFALADVLEPTWGPPLEAQVVWTPTNTVELDISGWESFEKFLQALDDQQDVQAVWHNGEACELIASEA